MAVVNSHPVQYFAPLYAFLNGDPSLEVTALYCSDLSLRGGMDPGFGHSVKWDVDLLGGYRSVFLGTRATSRVPGGFWSLVCPEVWTEIRSGRHDAVWLHGYAFAVDGLAFLAAKSRGLPVFYRSETHLGLRPAGWKRGVRDAVLSMAARFVDGFLAIGTANREYYRALGAPEHKIFDVPYSVDNDRFISAAKLTAREREAVRQKFGLPPGRPVVLFASKLMGRKHPDDLVHVMARLRDEGVAASLLFVGSGEMEPALRSLVVDYNLGGSVFFGGFVNQAELPSVYAASDLFVLPAENEPWGLIVNEVLCAGVPVIVAAQVGCVPDLVHDGENGLLVTAGDVASLTAAVRRLLADENARVSMGQKGLDLIQNWNYERCRRGLRAAVESLHVVG
ncbi:MAG TPA: glycosyltransferase family 4 protein [Vicinamibacterales bacterium]|nr:glycosyltransferase family 4 protein [Vicinamibacterales bacterium]